MRKNDYAADILARISPELKKRLEKIAVMQKKTVGEVIVYFLRQGANTPIILGIGC